MLDRVLEFPHLDDPNFTMRPALMLVNPITAVPLDVRWRVCPTGADSTLPGAAPLIGA